MKEVGTGGQNAYGYDGDGRRVRKNENGGGNLYFIWSSVLGKVAFEAMQGNSGTRVYVYAGKQQVAVRGADRGFYWSHTDHLGSLKKLTRTNGTVAYRAEYDPHGQRLLEWFDGATGLNPNKFTGYEFDSATGLEYANARMYYHNRGRFMQPDRLGLAAARAAHPQSLNRYTYVSNDPINRVDRNGLQDGPAGFEWNMGPPINPPTPRPPVPIGPHDLFDGAYLPDEGVPVDIGGIAQSTCAQFVDSLMSAVDQIGAAASLSIIGLLLAANAKYLLAPFAKELSYDGFKEKFIAGGQNAFAMVHIMGIAGAYLAGLDDEIARQFREDNEQLQKGLDLKAAGHTTIYYDGNLRYDLDKYIAEKRAELEDDRAGMSVGDLLYRKAKGTETHLVVQTKIFNLLCDK